MAPRLELRNSFFAIPAIQVHATFCAVTQKPFLKPDLTLQPGFHWVVGTEGWLGEHT